MDEDDDVGEEDLIVDASPARAVTLPAEDETILSPLTPKQDPSGHNETNIISNENVTETVAESLDKRDSYHNGVEPETMIWALVWIWAPTPLE